MRTTCLQRRCCRSVSYTHLDVYKRQDMPRIKYKSKMKEYYKKAGIAVARYHLSLIHI